MLSTVPLRRLRTALLATFLILCLASCGTKRPGRKDVVVLFTSDVHCGIESGFGYAGLWQLRESLEAEGQATLLVDDGDSIQGEPLGTLSRGEAIVGLMGDMRYDVAVPGNHEFDYGVDRFMQLAGEARFPYVCCNLSREGKPLLPAYVIKEAAGLKIAFVGVTTPETISSSSPSNFQDGDGNFIYSFMQDMTGDPLYEAVQSAVDGARAEGADYVYLVGHLGNSEHSRPWTCEDVLSHTDGIDVLLDGHSHDTERMVIRNKSGKDVVRAAVGSKLSCIGYSRISAKDGSIDTGIWRWEEKAGDVGFMGGQSQASRPAASRDGAAFRYGEENEIARKIRALREELEGRLGKAVADLDVDLSCADVRRKETNLGDFCTDAMRMSAGADIAVMNSGGIRAGLSQGPVTYGDLLGVFPFGNALCMVRASGRQILDALEWGARMLPGSSGGFLQVSGLSCVVDISVPNGCIADEYGMCIGIEGPRRVRGVTVGGLPLEEDALYTVAGPDYLLLKCGDGMTAFRGAEILLDGGDLLGCMESALAGLAAGTAGEYAVPAGQGRISFIGG